MPTVSLKHTQPVMTFLLAILFHFSCSAESSDDQTTAEGVETHTKAGTILIEAFEALPKITDPVAEFASSALGTAVEEAKSFNSLQIDTQLTTASTGISMGGLVSDLKSRFDANENASSSLCRTMNQAFRFMAGAVEPDLTTCYIEAAFGNRAEFYDGDYHIYDFSIVEVEDDQEETFNLRAKVKVEAEDDGTIKLFEAFLCESEEPGDPFTFIRYLKKTLTADSIKIYTKKFNVFNNNGDDQEIFIETEVNSNINSDGQMVGLKKINHSETSDDYNHVEKSIITQSNENIRYVGWSGSGDRLRKFYSFTELIDSNQDGEDYSPRKLAFGDGAAVIEISGSTTTEGWDGDTLSIDPDSERHVKVEGKESEFPTDTTPAELGWSDNQKFDCSGDAEADIKLGLEKSVACSDRYWIDQETSNLCERWGY